MYYKYFLFRLIQNKIERFNFSDLYSPMTWITYNEKPEEFSVENSYDIMPKIDIDPYASEELPRPMNITSFMNKVKH